MIFSNIIMFVRLELSETQNQEFYFEVTVSWSQTDTDYYVVKAKSEEEAKIIADNRFKNKNSHLPLIFIYPNKLKLIS
jgi:predicted secreted acid phosphatase